MQDVEWFLIIRFRKEVNVVWKACKHNRYILVRFTEQFTSFSVALKSHIKNDDVFLHTYLER